MIHIGEKPFQSSVSVMIISNYNSIHTCEKPIQIEVYAVRICCLSRTNTSEKVMIRQVFGISIRIDVSSFNYHNELINKSFFCTICGYEKSSKNSQYDICLDSYQTSITHECFTSHSKVYLLVCYGSGNTVRIYLIISTTVLSLIHCNMYQSIRMGLLRLVNLTPVRWLVIVYEYMVIVYLRYHALVI